MNRLVKKLLVFLIPILLVPFGLDNVLSGVLKKSNNYADGEYTTWNDLYGGKINSDIVIYGSSRAWVNIDPDMISDSLQTTAYNLGINGHTFLLQYFRHSLLLKYNTKPKIIIQTLDAGSMAKGTNLYNPDQFLPYMLNNKEMRQATIVYNGFRSIDYIIPLIRYYGKKEAILEIIKLIFNPAGNTIMKIKGYQGKDEMWNDDFKNAQQEIGSYEIKPDTSIIVLFEKYLNECKQQNIKIIFVYPPEFIDGQKFVRNRSDIMALYDKFSQEDDIPFFDYSNDSLSFQKKYFYNSSHLNKTGAELFTAKLIGDLKKSQIWVEK